MVLYQWIHICKGHKGGKLRKQQAENWCDHLHVTSTGIMDQIHQILWIRYIPPSPGRVWPDATTVSEEWHYLHVTACSLRVSEGSSQRLVVMERKCRIVPWSNPAAAQLCDYGAEAAAWKQELWAAPTPDTSAEKPLEAWSHGLEARLPQKIITAIFLSCKINAGCSTSSVDCWKILHCYYVWRVFSKCHIGM